jgi:hypothetical protein
LEADAVLFFFLFNKSSVYGRNLPNTIDTNVKPSCLVHALDPLMAFLAALAHNMEEWVLFSQFNVLCSFAAGTLTVPSATPTPRKGASAELSASFTSACLLSAFGLSLILL